MQMILWFYDSGDLCSNTNLFSPVDLEARISTWSMCAMLIPAAHLGEGLIQFLGASCNSQQDPCMQASCVEELPGPTVSVLLTLKARS